MRFTRTWLSLIIISTVCFTGVLIVYVYTGSLMRYSADDYCMASDLNKLGFLEAQKYTYLTWSGRFTFTFIVSFFEITLIPILIPAPLIIWFIGLTWTILQWTALASLPHSRLLAIFLASMILFVTLESLPNIFESLYWRAGMLTYTAPLIFFTGFIGLVSYHLRSNQESGVVWPWLTLSFIITFIGGGFSETFLGIQIAVLVLTVVFLGVGAYPSFIINKRFILLLLIAGLGGSLAAAAIVMAAPGNAIRQSYHSPLTDWPAIIWLATIYMILFLKGAVFNSSIKVLLSLLLPFLGAVWIDSLRLNYESALLIFDGLAVVMFGLIFLCFLPVVYAIGIPLPDRGYVIPQFILTCWLINIGFILGLLAKQISPVNQFTSTSWFAFISFVVVLGLLGAGPIIAFSNRLDSAIQMHAVTTAWDQRDIQIRQAQIEGVADLIVPPLPDSVVFQDGIGSDPKYWVNSCAADYYKVHSIATQ